MKDQSMMFEAKVNIVTTGLCKIYHSRNVVNVK